ncbi:hypothetical protein LJC15_04440 [Desulfovibrio sp. OttesenSCG-928-G11]|nr:hypothetical protein [Desulfovibrio sp. OttesenSCG-928-G11]
MTKAHDAIIIDSILQSEKTLLAGIECARVYTQVVEELIQRRPSMLTEYCKNQDFPELKWRHSDAVFNSQDPGPLIGDSDMLQERNIGILAEGTTGFRDISLGIYWLNKNIRLEWGKLLYEKLNTQLGRSADCRKDSSWLWRIKHAEWRNWTTPEALLSLHRKELTKPEEICLDIYRAVKEFFAEHPQVVE